MLRPDYHGTCRRKVKVSGTRVCKDSGRQVKVLPCSRRQMPSCSRDFSHFRCQRLCVVFAGPCRIFAWHSPLLEYTRAHCNTGRAGTLSQRAPGPTLSVYATNTLPKASKICRAWRGPPWLEPPIYRGTEKEGYRPAVDMSMSLAMMEPSGQDRKSSSSS